MRKDCEKILSEFLNNDKTVDYFKFCDGICIVNVCTDDFLTTFLKFNIQNNLIFSAQKLINNKYVVSQNYDVKE